MMHGHPIPPGYARVSIDRILDKKYNKIHIDYPTKEDRPHLDQNRGTIVAWCKLYIKFINQPSKEEIDDESTLHSAPMWARPPRLKASRPLVGFGDE
jgi:hypothetical protein